VVPVNETKAPEFGEVIDVDDAAVAVGIIVL